MSKINLNERLGNSNDIAPDKLKPKKNRKNVRRKNPLQKIEKIKTTEKKEDFNYEEFDNDLLNEETERQKAEEKQEEKQIRINKVIQIMLLILCVYIVFLIYGLINTQFVYDANGQVVPMRMNIESIQKKSDYEELLLQYRQTRTLYEHVLTLDYRVGAGEEDPMVIAPDYEKQLDDIEKLVLQIGALELPAEYTQTTNMLLIWVKDDIAVYCQSMSKAISQNNAESAEIAVQYKTKMYNDFSMITQNVLILGQQVKGVDTSDIDTWSPEKYIQDEIGGVLS